MRKVMNKRARVVLFAIAAATMLYLWGVMVRGRGLRGPELSFPFGWQWRYRAPVRPMRMLVPLGCFAAAAAGLVALRRRAARLCGPRAILGCLVAGSVLFRISLTVSDPALLNAGPARVLLPRPLDFLLDGQAAKSFRELLSRRPSAHARLRGHSLTKPPGPVAFARLLLAASRRMPWLRGAVLAAHRSLPRFEAAAGATTDENMLAAAIAWAYAMAACAIAAALPLYAVARGLVGTRGALWAAAFWLFSPSIVLFSPEASQAVALLGLVSLWLLHEAYERGSAVRAALAVLALWAAAAINLSGLAVGLVLAVYLAARIAFDLPAGGRVALAAIALTALAASSAAAGWFEAIHRIVRFQQSGYLYDAGPPTWRGIVHAALVWNIFEPSRLCQFVMLSAGAALHLALFFGASSALCRSRARTTKARWREWAKVAAGLAAAMLVGWAAVRFGLGVRPAKVFRAAFVGSHAKALTYLNYWVWARWNPVCFFVFSGLPAALLWVWACMSGQRPRASASAAMFAVCLVLLSLNVSGFTRGEVERIWAPLLPLVMVAAGSMAAKCRAHQRWLAALFALHVGQTIVFSEFLVV